MLHRYTGFPISDVFIGKITVVDEVRGITSDLEVTVDVYVNHHPDSNSFHQSYETTIFRSNCDNEERTYKRTSWLSSVGRQQETDPAVIELLDGELDSYLWRHGGARLYDVDPHHLPKAIVRAAWWTRLWAILRGKKVFHG